MWSHHRVSTREKRCRPRQRKFRKVPHGFFFVAAGVDGFAGPPAAGGAGTEAAGGAADEEAAGGAAEEAPLGAGGGADPAEGADALVAGAAEALPDGEGGGVVSGGGPGSSMNLIMSSMSCVRSFAFLTAPSYSGLPAAFSMKVSKTCLA